MSEGTKSRSPTSLDALLSANRDSFDRLFRHQMDGGGAARPAVPDARRAAATEAPTPAADDAPASPAPPAPPVAAAAEPAGRIAAPADPATVDAIVVNRVDIALGALRHEMEAVFARHAVSPPPVAGPTGPAMICDGRGAMISGRAGSFLGHMLSERKLQIDAGDVLLLSDPFACAGATGDLTGWIVVTGVFDGPDLVGFTVMRGRMADVGGPEAGSRPARAGSVFAEGLCIPPVKVHAAGVPNQAALDVILANSRSPRTNRADLEALIAACRAGAAGVRRLIARIGAGAYHRACAALLARTRDAVSRVIVERLPEEPQSFEDRIDDDGCANGAFTLRVTAWREGDHAYFDWTGTSDQAPGPINCYLHVGLAKTFVGNYLMRTFAGHVPANDGFYDLIHVTLPKGSLLNPAPPAALGHGEHALVRQSEVLGSAIDRHAPQRLSAAGYGSVPVFSYAGDGFRMTDQVFGGRPAWAGGDGRDGACLWRGGRTAAAEHLESQYPVVVERCAAVPGSGGAGLHRGGNGVEKVYRMRKAGRISIQDDRQETPPWGVGGGRPGARSAKWIERADGTREALPAKFDGLAVLPNDRITFRAAGGGGWGNPFERDAGLVRRDVLHGLLSAEDAASEYGVILQGEMREIDHRATEEFRAGLNRDRNRGKLFDRGDPA